MGRHDAHLYAFLFGYVFGFGANAGYRPECHYQIVGIGHIQFFPACLIFLYFSDSGPADGGLSPPFCSIRVQAM